MDNDPMQPVADGLDAPEILDPGSAIDGFRASSSSTIATASISTPRGLSNSTDPSSPESDNFPTLQPLEGKPHVAIADNNTVVSPISDITETEARARQEAAVWLCILQTSGADRPAKRSYEQDVDVEADILVQKPKRTRVPTLRSLGADFASRRQAASSSKSSHGLTAAPVTHKPARTPLPFSRPQIEPSRAVSEATQESIENSKFFSQNYDPGQGWNAVNNGPQTLLRAEDDLTYPINTIIHAPHAPADQRNRRYMSAPPSPEFALDSPPATGFETASQPSPIQAYTAAAPSVDTAVPGSLTPPLLGGGLMRAATNPFTSRVASKASNTATSSGSGSNWAKISAKARALNSTDATSDVPDPDATSSGHSSTSPSPSALPNPARRTKWTGKSFATLTLEALRGASSANHMLTINQITTYIEAYRRTTDMSLPALPQTIRAAVHRNCKPKKANGLWEHVPDEGKRTGRYRLLVEGLVGDVEDVEEGEEEEVEEEEKGESEGCEEL